MGLAWVFHYVPDVERESMEWNLLDSPVKKVFWS